ncbi:acetoin utilization AcuB family protein [Halalkalibacterium halodurans]|uniref:Acetoin dehydrogenase n=1 Tax=Halalkalibacterium halodurans (strain ATCC BAA-125 / DSM 18197 / FERM 7344 / JCM 9153 / C-125) TaxID=272558 RepID=Q9K7X2_HALH5|nr:acetoin utilization AcuB family protein [Halalkalibacterium halodurans]MDY7223769.1 acetoin utilization AcuB family protein [Halalkalibacterium halodurans]MDY7242990.1 acetoin utilization AcuB family protein [Halalkalibacterium halodurans]MED4080011.1 acetoin utilization AcuB family protein [Halalkalibacterium halodurans]MED4084417.1 acetoin utilization AcuB family protein [Halalkalibacterium halodurans]MED4104987.1 acetoin utilization AcuB family protein [Halalkalibacterium halodurans]
MLIEEIMKRNVVTIHEQTTIKEAYQTMILEKFRHLPVITKSKDVIGIVTDQDIRDASPSIFHQDEHQEDLQKPVSSIMTKDVITVHPLNSVAETARLLYENRISCLPVTEGEQLVGIVTDTDVLHTLVELMGAHQPSSQIYVRVENKAGQLADVAAIMKQRQMNIASVLVYPHREDERYKILAFRIQSMDPRGTISDLQSKGYHVLWPNIPGIAT